MDDPAKVVIVLSVLATAAYTVRSVARGAIAVARDKGRFGELGNGSLTEARLARIEAAVDAIAIEVERISEGQRFTTRLLSDNKLLYPRPDRRELSTNTPT
jgi:hypothetical protein